MDAQFKTDRKAVIGAGISAILRVLSASLKKIRICQVV